MPETSDATTSNGGNFTLDVTVPITSDAITDLNDNEADDSGYSQVLYQCHPKPYI